MLFEGKNRDLSFGFTDMLSVPEMSETLSLERAAWDLDFCLRSSFFLPEVLFTFVNAINDRTTAVDENKQRKDTKECHVVVVCIKLTDLGADAVIYFTTGFVLGTKQLSPIWMFHT